MKNLHLVQPVSSVTQQTMPTSEISPFVREGDELALSGQALGALLDAVVGRGLPFRFKAGGISMTPFIRDGDIITVSPLGSDSPGHGDVVAFARPGSQRLIVHRVVGKEEAGWLIRGDSCGRAEGPIPRVHLTGKVTSVEREGRRVLIGMGPERLVIPWLLSHQRLFSSLRGAWRSARRIIRRRR